MSERTVEKLILAAVIFAAILLINCWIFGDFTLISAEEDAGLIPCAGGGYCR